MRPNRQRIQAILEFWFEGIDDSTPADRQKNPFKKWFLQDKQFDDLIREEFESDLTHAAQGKNRDWESDALGRLALIILFDQFSRNIFRDAPHMYAFDHLALALALKMIRGGQDTTYLLIHRAFIYLPLMHAEDTGIQNLSVEQYTGLVELSKKKCPRNTPYYEYTLQYARDHHAAILTDGRFLYRDRILNRT